MNNSEVIYDTSEFHVSEPSQKSSCLSDETMSLITSPDDIYELATDIGHEFEKLVQNYGYDTFASLLPKVVHVLESLEISLKKSESTNIKLTEMRQAVVALEKERIQRNSDRHKFENDVDEMETQWKVEKAELVAAIRTLTEENLTLHKTLGTFGMPSLPCESRSCQTSISPSQSDNSLEYAASSKAISQLQQKISRLTEELNEKQYDCDALHSQLDRLARQNASLLESHALSRREIEQLIEEKSELEAQLVLGERKVQELMSSLNVMRQKEKDELEISQMASRSDVRQAVAERNELRYRLVTVDEQLKRAANCHFDYEEFVVSRKSSFERHYSLDESSVTTPLPDLNLSESSDERVVYGPINREPDDKADPDEKAPASSKRIRDFFKRLFGSNK